MKVALIPPIPELNTFGRGKFHLLLSHLLRDKQYADHYAQQRKQGAYLVLDNSAHEHGEGDDPEALMFNALALDAQEVVVPDCLDNAEKTIERTIEALETWFENRYAQIKKASPALMYVPQGRNEADWVSCLHEQMRLHAYLSSRFSYREDVVVGLSKDYESWHGGLIHLVDTWLVPFRKILGKRFQVHLLGWGRKIWDLESIARAHPWIRSTDSAKPFVYALSNINLDRSIEKRKVPQYPKRSPEYFTTEMTQRQRDIAKINTMIFAAVASGDVRNTVIL